MKQFTLRLFVSVVLLRGLSFGQKPAAADPGRGKMGAAEFAWRLGEQTGPSSPATAQVARKQDEIMERIWCGDASDQATQEVCWRAYQARMKYYIGAMDHRTRIFWWQHVASRIIFGVVIGLVGLGVYFAWVQFRKDLFAAGSAQHELEVAPGGIKISSPVLGVVILGLSLGFFYLYLNYVFPVVETF